MNDKKEVILKQYAEKLHNREYRNELNAELIAEAKEKQIVVVYGASDDLCELEGAIYDEVDCYDGGDVYFQYGKVLRNDCESDCPYFQMLIEQAEAQGNHIKIISDIFDGRRYETTIPHETFDILDDGEIYCKGIVFYIESLK